jgi:CubicO group peptidase (beta-lactamase class C family)
MYRGARGRFAAVLVVLTVAAPTTADAQAPVLAGIDSYVEAAMQQWEVPGFALAVIRNDSVILARGYGVTRLGGMERVDENTLFAIASTTKAMTTAALGMLVDDGLLKWDDPVHRTCRALQLRDPYITRELTVRDLLTHRAASRATMSCGSRRRSTAPRCCGGRDTSRTPAGSARSTATTTSCTSPPANWSRRCQG